MTSGLSMAWSMCECVTKMASSFPVTVSED
jgi:hypothetical protein